MPVFRQGTTYKLRIVPAGYEFLGPGNDVAFTVPRNYNDAVAKAHDIAYGELIDAGYNPYITYSQADADFLANIQPNDLPTYIAQGLFSTKKFLANVGILDTGTFISKYASTTSRPPCPQGLRVVTS